MKLVYVAGPFRAATPWGVELNIRHAEALALEVCRLGAVGVCPHTMWRHFDKSLPDEFWLAAGLHLLDRCDAVVLGEGWRASRGTLREIERACLLGLHVFETLSELALWLGDA